MQASTVKRHARLLGRNCEVFPESNIVRIFGRSTLEELPKITFTMINAVCAASRLEESLRVWIREQRG